MEAKPRPTLRKAQLQAYIAVLRALSSVKLDWSKQKLLVELRKQLRISVEQHVRALDKVVKDPEVTAIREGLPLPLRSARAPPSKRERPSSPQKQPQHEVQPPTTTPHEDGRATKIQRRQSGYQPRGRGGAKQGKRGRLRGGLIRGSSATGVSAASSTSTASTSHAAPARTPLADVEVDKFVGKKVEVFWQDHDPQWTEAVITDYNPEMGKHCVTYDFNTGHESWHWLEVNKDIKKGKIRLLPGPPVGLLTVVPMKSMDKPEEDGKLALPGCGINISELSVPFENSVLTKCLEWGTAKELEEMHAAVVKRQKTVLRKLMDMGKEGLEGADDLVKELVERERLVCRQNELMEKRKMLELQGQGQNNG